MARLWFLFTVVVLCCSADSFDELRQKRLNMITGGAGLDYALPQIHSRLTSIESTARNNWNSLQKAPNRTALWTDTASTTVSAQITTAWSRLNTMALAWATPGQGLSGDATLLADLRAAMSWMEQNRYNARSKEYDNWWDWEIGVPLQLGDLLVLLYDQLTPDEITRYTAAIDHFDSDPRVMIVNTVSTGANRVWKCTGAVLRAIAAKDAAKLQLASDSLSPVFAYVTSSDGFYTDGSFIQHTGHPYTGGYGTSLLSQLSGLLFLLAGSPWDVSDPARDNVFRWVFDSFQPVIYRGAMMDMVRGREVSRSGSPDHATGHTTIAAISRVARFAPADLAPAMLSMVKECLLSDASRDWASNTDLDEIMPLAALLADDTIARRGELTGSWVFASMDRAVHLRPGWGLGVAMHSSRIYNYESINNENLRGWHSGDGMTYLYNSDLLQFSNNFWPTVDPQRLPGTTVVAGSTERQSQTGGSRTVGGATLGGYSAVMLQLNPDGRQLNAKKSWFLLDNAVIALGSDIRSTASGATVETIIENRVISGDPAFTASDDKTWAHLAGAQPENDIGYFFPDGAVWNQRREDRQGSWNQINSGGSTSSITRRYQTLWFDHGIAPVSASYSYALLPGRTAEDVAAYAAAPDFGITENSAQAHAITDAALGLRAVNFWADVAKTSAGITADRISSVLTIESNGLVQVAIADPTQANTGVIHIEIDRAVAAVASKDDTITVDQMEPTLKLTVNVKNTRGRTQVVQCTLAQ